MNLARSDLRLLSWPLWVPATVDVSRQRVPPKGYLVSPHLVIYRSFQGAAVTRSLVLGKPLAFFVGFLYFFILSGSYF
jgi:hypothetical protein